MKIGVNLFPLWPGLAGGHETYVRNLLRTFEQDSKNTYYIDYCTLESSGNEFRAWVVQESLHRDCPGKSGNVRVPSCATQGVAHLIRRLPGPDRQLKIFRAEAYTDETEDFIREAAAQYRALQLARSREVKHLEAAYWESEADPAARLLVIEEQGKRIAQMDRDIAFLNEAIRSERGQKGA